MQRKTEQNCINELEKVRQSVNDLKVEVKVEKNKNSDLRTQVSISKANISSPGNRQITKSHWEIPQQNSVVIKNYEHLGRSEFFKSKFVTQNEEYETEVFQNIERGNLPSHLYCKYVIKKS